MPLSVWDRKGFDAARIELTTDPKDIMETPQLGKCYRVKMLTTHRRGVRGTEQVSSASTAVDRKRSADTAFDRKPVEGKSTGVCLAGSAEDWGETMKRLKSQRAAEVAEVRAQKTIAIAVLKKLCGPLATLQATMEINSAENLPIVVTKQVQANITKAMELESLAKAVTEGAGEINEDSKDVCRALKKRATCLWTVIMTMAIYI